MKKMTCKEFKEAFEQAGFSFNLWGWEGILNIIGCECFFEAKNNEQLGLFNIAEREQKCSDIIHDILKERGFYNN